MDRNPIYNAASGRTLQHTVVVASPVFQMLLLQNVINPFDVLSACHSLIDCLGGRGVDLLCLPKK